MDMSHPAESALLEEGDQTLESSSTEDLGFRHEVRRSDHYFGGDRDDASFADGMR